MDLIIFFHSPIKLLCIKQISWHQSLKNKKKHLIIRCAICLIDVSVEIAHLGPVHVHTLFMMMLSHANSLETNFLSRFIHFIDYTVAAFVSSQSLCLKGNFSAKHKAKWSWLGFMEVLTKSVWETQIHQIKSHNSIHSQWESLIVS